MPKHGLMKYMTKAKCRHLKNLTSEMTLRQVFICPIPPPTHVNVRLVLIHTGKSGRWCEREPERRLEEQQLTKLGRKYQRE
jgi:hypothetical protein